MAIPRKRGVTIRTKTFLVVASLLIAGGVRLWNRCEGMVLTDTRRTVKESDEVILSRALGHFRQEETPIRQVYFRAIPLVVLGIGGLGMSEGRLAAYTLDVELGTGAQPALPWELDPVSSSDTVDWIIKDLGPIGLADSKTLDSIMGSIDNPEEMRILGYERKVTQMITTRVLVDRGTETSPAAVYVFTTPFLHPDPWFITDEGIEQINQDLATFSRGEALPPAH